MDATPTWKWIAAAVLVVASMGRASAADETAETKMEEVLVEAPRPSRSMEEIAAATTQPPPIEAITINVGEVEISRPNLDAALRVETEQ